ncbi:hypothetical protein NMG60_11024445 [Bertholletia excelsa]
MTFFLFNNLSLTTINRPVLSFFCPSPPFEIGTEEKLPFSSACMATSKLLIASFLISLLLSRVEADDMMCTVDAPSPSPAEQPIDCGAACTARCRLSSRPRLCHRACGSCCSRCNCVPPGTSGNLETCPCYANMTTHGNRRKCP